MTTTTATSRPTSPPSTASKTSPGPLGDEGGVAGCTWFSSTDVAGPPVAGVSEAATRPRLAATAFAIRAARSADPSSAEMVSTAEPVAKLAFTLRARLAALSSSCSCCATGVRTAGVSATSAKLCTAWATNCPPCTRSCTLVAVCSAT